MHFSMQPRSGREWREDRRIAEIEDNAMLSPGVTQMIFRKKVGKSSGS